MKFFSRAAIGLLVAVGFLGSATAVSDGPDLAFEAAWVRAMPPGMKMTAGFGMLRNLGEAPLELVGFSSPQFGEVSLHRSETVDGVSRMREQDTLTIDAGAAVELAPGGYHLMLMMPVGDGAPEGVVVIELQTADGATYEFRVPVERR